MLTPVRCFSALLFGLAVLAPSLASAEPNTGGGPSTFNCTGIPRTCGAWGAKGPNTCRTCNQALCKKENGKEVIAGNKIQTECYEGHGPAPLQHGGITLPQVPAGTLKRQSTQ